MSGPAQIKIQPDPPVRGQPAVLTYTGSTPVTLTVTYEPPGVSYQFVIGPDGLEVEIPKDAFTMTIVDTTGNAPGRDLPVA